MSRRYRKRRHSISEDIVRICTMPSETSEEMGRGINRGPHMHSGVADQLPRHRRIVIRWHAVPLRNRRGSGRRGNRLPHPRLGANFAGPRTGTDRLTGKGRSAHDFTSVFPTPGTKGLVDYDTEAH